MVAVLYCDSGGSRCSNAFCSAFVPLGCSRHATYASNATIAAPKTAPTPMPAFAPVDRPPPLVFARGVEVKRDVGVDPGLADVIEDVEEDLGVKEPC